jgi:hypothetical protein
MSQVLDLCEDSDVSGEWSYCVCSFTSTFRKKLGWEECQ